MRRRRTAAEPLDLGLLDFSCNGVARSDEQIAVLPAQEREDYDALYPFELRTPAKVTAAYEAHRAEIDGAWKRRGGRGKPWAARQRGRRLSRPLSPRDQRW